MEQAQDFLDAWERYPKRAGANPRNDAHKAWKARQAEGVPTKVMLAGLDRYVKSCEARNQVGTEFVMQAKRFFGPSRIWEDEWIIPPPAVAKTFGAPVEVAGGTFVPGSAKEARTADAIRQFLGQEQDIQPAPVALLGGGEGNP